MCIVAVVCRLGPVQFDGCFPCVKDRHVPFRFQCRPRCGGGNSDQDRNWSPQKIDPYAVRSASFNNDAYVNTCESG